MLDVTRAAPRRRRDKNRGRRAALPPSNKTPTIARASDRRRDVEKLLSDIANLLDGVEKLLGDVAKVLSDAE